MQICFSYIWASETSVFILKPKAAAACLLWVTETPQTNPASGVSHLVANQAWLCSLSRVGVLVWLVSHLWVSTLLGSLALCCTLEKNENQRAASDLMKAMIWVGYCAAAGGDCTRWGPSAPPVPAEQTGSGQSALLRVISWMLPEGSCFCACRKVSPEHWWRIAWLRNRFFFPSVFKIPFCLLWMNPDLHFSLPSRTHYQKSWQSMRKMSKNLMLLWKPCSEAVS